MQILAVIIVLIIVVGSMVLHEWAHGMTAYLLGDETAKLEGRLSLNPIVHLDPMMSVIVPVVLFMLNQPVFGGAKPVPVDNTKLKYGEYGMALVAAAGPAMNFLLALGFFLIGHWTGMMYLRGSLWQLFFVQGLMANLGFMVFNLFPIPPLDGSRILYALMPDGVRKVMRGIESVGVSIVFALVMLAGPVFGNIMTEVIKQILRGFYWVVGG